MKGGIFININRNYKDSVFTRLFSNKKELINLYNAIKNTNYKLEDTELNIITLENVLFMDRNNDLCFTIDDKLIVLIEHQSSINDNMPLRFLMYIAREYEKILDDKNIYKSKLVKIPTPEFIVLYNGKEKYPKNNKLYLSNAFHNKGNSNLELVVDVININYDVNNNILEKSNTLNGYSYFIYLIRIYNEQYKDKVESDKLLEFCIKKAMETCVNEDVLNDFLKSNGSEVFNMLSVEFNIDVAKEVWKEEAFESGFEDGMQQGIQQGIQRGIQRGIQQGIQQGIIKQINTLKRLKFNKNDIISIIMEDYNITREEIEKYL